MKINTYFGFFAQTLFTAMGTALGSSTGRKVALETVELHGTNLLKLHQAGLDTLLLPRQTVPPDPPYLYVLFKGGPQALGRLAPKVSPQRLMEQAAAAAMEPWSYVTRARAQLTALAFTRPAPGVLPRHLGDDAHVTLAVGRFGGPGLVPFQVGLLVGERGVTLVEERTQAQPVQRAFHAVVQGQYLCQPQWAPAAYPPPPSATPSALPSPDLPQTTWWLQSFLALNGGTLANKVFRQPAAFSLEPAQEAAVTQDTAQAQQVGVARLSLEENQDLFFVVPPESLRGILSLSKSAQPAFLGDFFRALLKEPAQLWEALGAGRLAWRVTAVRTIPPQGLSAMAPRLKGGGWWRQRVRLADGDLAWWVGVTPTAGAALWNAAQKGGRPDSLPAPWSPSKTPTSPADPAAWRALAALGGPGDPRQLVRLLMGNGVLESDLEWLAQRLGPAIPGSPLAQAWKAVLPGKPAQPAQQPGTVSNTLSNTVANAGAGAYGRLAHALVKLRLEPSGWDSPMAQGAALLAERVWQERQALLDRWMPVSHLVYGMDRLSLQRLCYDTPNPELAALVSQARFRVMDQVRRVISPGFGVRLLEDAGAARLRVNAMGAQQATIGFYRRCWEGMQQGRYTLRETPAQRLGRLMALLDGEAESQPPL
ncbi:MAG: hypothetical protein OEV94_04550 [Deltaproteobacteria bacterium]|nr:hypothetical protein [Deltaproteobacteria bacterium]